MKKAGNWGQRSKIFLILAIIAVLAIVGGTYYYTGSEENGVSPDNEAGSPEFEVKNLSVEPDSIPSNGVVTVSVFVSNTGDGSGTYKAEIEVNGETSKKEISLEPGENGEVSFELSKDKAGTYSVKIGGFREEFRVKEKAPPRIEARENRLVADGEEITLRGLSIADPYELDHADDQLTKEMFDKVVEWNANAVRVPIHPGWWVDEPNYADKYLDDIVQWCKERDLYVILDWHAIGNPLTGEAQAAAWYEGSHDEVYDSDLKLAGQAWEELSSRYSENSHVIFEIFNEPTALGGVGNWNRLSEAFNNLIDDNIRGNAPETLILVSGWEWTYDLSGYEYNPIKDNNFAYVAHHYAESPKEYPDISGWESNFGFMTNQAPVVVTEWGFSETAEDAHFYGNRKYFGNPFLNYIESKNMHWTAWCFHPTWGPRMLKNWNYERTAWGDFVHEALMSDKEKPQISIESPENGDSLNWTTKLKGQASDDISLTGVQIKIGDKGFRRVENIEFSEDYSEADWRYSWDTFLVEDGEYKITVRAIDTSHNITERRIHIQVNNPEDDNPPELNIESPENGTSVEGQIEISGMFRDQESGLRNIRVMIDGKGQTAWVSDRNESGIFYETELMDGSWRASWYSPTVSDNRHDIVVKAKDRAGNTTTKSVNVQVNNGNQLSSCDETGYWSSYSGGGSSIEISSVTGTEGKAIRVDYSGSSGGWWGMNKPLYRDFSNYSGIEFDIKGKSTPIRMTIKDSGQEHWTTEIKPSESWERMKIPFEEFQKRSWQPDDAEEDGTFGLNPVTGIEFIQPPGGYESEDGHFIIDNIRLTEN